MCIKKYTACFKILSLLCLSVVGAQASAATVLFSDDFEAGMGNWSNTSTGDDFSWYHKSGTTASSGTGPSGGADGSLNYVYFETSSSDAYYAGQTSILEGPDLNGLNNGSISFKYHMFGGHIGTLSVDILSGGNWVNGVWSISGQQQSSVDDPYIEATVDLSAYTVDKIRFKGIAAGDYQGDIALDDIIISEVIYGPVAPVFNNDPVIKTDAFQEKEYSASIAQDAVDANGDLIIFSKVSGPSWLTITTDGQLSGIPSATDVGINQFVIEASDGALSTTAILQITVNDNLTPILLSRSDFESGFGDWSNVTDEDNENWTRNSGATPSGSTGPDSGADGSSYYVFLETSSGEAYQAGDVAILQGPELNQSDIHVKFKYHMYGSKIGTLSVDAKVDGSWINDLWTISGQQQASGSSDYNEVDVDLGMYAVTQVRFRAIASGGYTGDMAIDSVELWTIPKGPVAPAFNANPLTKSEATQNIAYSDSIAGDADDANGDPITFTKVDGPDWLIVSSDGTLSGTPTPLDVGMNSFTVETSDGVLSSTATLNIKVKDGREPIVISSSDFESDWGEWQNVTDEDDFSWYRKSGQTASSGTGPSGGADGSSYYVYFETSSNDAYYAGQTSIIESNDLAGLTDGSISFKYHMFGGDIGTLYLDVYSSGSWIDGVWSIAGQQQASLNAPYTETVVDLSNYSIDKIRFRAVAAGDYQGDIALDDITIYTLPQVIDTDGDGIEDGIDQCSNTPVNETADATGCSASQRDTDGDGVVDSLDAFPNDPNESVDTDGDGVGDNADQCPEPANQGTIGSDGCTEYQRDTDNDGVVDALDAFPNDPNEQYDTDGDGVGDNADQCPEPANQGTVGSDGCTEYQRDTDGDGVVDALDAFPNDPNEQYDTDGDGVGDNADQCPEPANQGTVGSDGCTEYQRDTDNDGVVDAQDAFPNDPNEQYDTDGDGVGDNADQCPEPANQGTIGSDGCTEFQRDTDGDGIVDALDAFPNDPNEQYDIDGDGVGDNADQCPDTVIREVADQNGCSVFQRDTDGDGYFDAQDEFPNDPNEHSDMDDDGIGDNADQCPETIPHEVAGPDGCSVFQRDSDEDGIYDFNDEFANNPNESNDADRDGIGDNADQCPETMPHEVAGPDGCSVFQRDSDEDGIYDFNDEFVNNPNESNDADEDGIGDNADQCPETMPHEVAGPDGCSVFQRDADEDGIRDFEDRFPADPNEHLDSDDDGVGDNSDGCPYTPAFEIVGPKGCELNRRDTDGDGVFDMNDHFHKNPNEHLDIDDDGIGENADHCPGTPYRDTVDSYGCTTTPVDSDGDGVMDGQDDLPNDPNEQSDEDRDGIGENADQCPSTERNQIVNENGCALDQIDTDGDGLYDNMDELPQDPNEQHDADRDGVGDNSDQCPDTVLNEIVDANGCALYDLDSDGDGVNDLMDDFPHDPNEQHDSDNDGVGELSDQCPDTVFNEIVDANGCALYDLDSDGDGVNDLMDDFPHDPNEQHDSDNDGIGELSDQCPDTVFNEIVDANGCALYDLDSDGDGVNDLMDDFPQDPNEQHDEDRDGIGDNADQCPDTILNENVNDKGCVYYQRGGDYVRSLSLSRDYSCAVVNGETVCWGQVPEFNEFLPAEVNETSQIAVGFNSVCILTDNQVYCRSSNQDSQLIQKLYVGSETYNAAKLSVTEMDNTACVITLDNILHCWGDDYTIANSPILPGVQQVDLYNQHACAHDGQQVVCWGTNYSGQLDVPILHETPVDIAVGTSHSCVLDASHSVICWGDNQSGQLEVPEDIGEAISIEAGGSFTCALNLQGKVTCWGKNNNGEIDVPESVVTANDIVAGPYNMCALQNGEYICWGNNQFGQSSIWYDVVDYAVSRSDVCSVGSAGIGCFGNHSYGPYAYSLPEGVDTPKVIGGGTEHFCAWADSGMHCWGYQSEGLAPALDYPEGLTNVTEIDAADAVTCAIDGGRVVCWGYNPWGVVDEISVPGDVRGLDLSNYYGCVIGENSSLPGEDAIHCWGDHEFIPDSPISIEPGAIVSVGGGTMYAPPKVAYTCLYSEIRGFMCFNGDSDKGDTNPTEPLNNVIDLYAGYGKSCAIMENGSVECWGDQAFGEHLKGINIGGVVDIKGYESKVCVRNDRVISCSGLSGGALLLEK